jgi:cytochrome c-type biogenesis protein CcmE
MRRRNRRLLLAISCVGLAGLAAALVLWALRSTATYFYSPSDLAALTTKPQSDIRIGGLVERGSIIRGGPQHIDFKVTDLKSELDVTFSGVLPSLFREGQGVVAEGRLEDGKFVAHTILAKHDENYMPPEVEKALKNRGLWHEDGKPHPPQPAATVAQPSSS